MAEPTTMSNATASTSTSSGENTVGVEGSGSNNNNNNVENNNNESSSNGTGNEEGAKTSLSNSGKKEKPAHPAKLTSSGKKDSKINLHSDGSPKSPSPYVGVKDEFTDWVPVFNKVGRGMTPILAPKDHLSGDSPKGGVVKEFSSPPIPTKKINFNSKDKASYDDSDDELSPDDDGVKQLPTFVLQNKPAAPVVRERMSDVVSSPRLPPAITDIPSSPKLIPVPSSPGMGPATGPGAQQHHQQQQQQPKKKPPPPEPEPESSTSEEEEEVKKAPPPMVRRQPSGNRLIPHPAMGKKSGANRISTLATVSKRKQSMDSNYLKNLTGDDTEEEESTLISSEREVKPKSEELVRELFRDGNVEVAGKTFKAVFGEKYKNQALDNILRKSLQLEAPEERLHLSSLLRRLRKTDVIRTDESLENTFTNVLEDLVRITELYSNAPIHLGEMIANAIADKIIGGEFLNVELAREEIVRLGISETVMESMLKVLTTRDLKKRVEENNWRLAAFIKPEDMDLKTREWLKSRGYGKIY
eukprot:TRINITY_DN86_c1_g1_i1.p1 TRINITY_DN86_c1_g1~~TRINITY_DN86_c1_g1_i1.p1  ORF type:complete len:537 (-),score=189.31 TRINITY_DN86_c1_g1_i1:163-1746(-)